MRNYLIKYVSDVITLILLAILIGCGSESIPNEPVVAAKGVGAQSFSSILSGLAPRYHGDSSSAPSVLSGDSLTSTWTVVARFTPSVAHLSQRLIEMGGYNSPDGLGMSLEWGDNNTVSCITWNGAGSGLVSPATVVVGSEYTVVCSYDNGTMSLYINGVLTNSMTGAGYSDSTGNMGVGRSPYNGSSYDFQGSVSDIATFRRVLSASEIESLK